ncbi:putative phage abortive infection protein [Vogesella indigofera]|uniref:putative phage abortive infection protein n=1 Tax=Vogesella indigofera TaxID=45465 RepID=UPI003F41FB68
MIFSFGNIIFIAASFMIFFAVILYFDGKNKWHGFSKYYDVEKGDQLFVIKLFDAAIVAVLLVFCLDFMILALDSNHSAGEFGDFAGGVLNPVLSFLTFVGLLWGLTMQRREMAAAREEFEKTREVLDRQTELQSKQRFDSLITAMVSILISDKSQLSDKIEGGRIDKGLIRWMLDHIKNDDLIVAALTVSENDNIFEPFYKKIFSLLRFVAVEIGGASYHLDDEFLQREVSAEEKQYVDIVKSLLSTFDLKLLMIRICHDDMPNGCNGFVELINRYALFDGVAFYLGVEKDDLACEAAAKLSNQAFDNNFSYRYAIESGHIQDPQLGLNLRSPAFTAME